jgi:hypothetical protein
MGALLKLLLKFLQRSPKRLPKPPAKSPKAKDRANDEGSADKKRDECVGQCKKSRKDLEDEANVTQQTKGKTKHGQKNGGTAQANKDFDALGPKDVKDINTQYGPGRTGVLDDGSKVTVRPGSSDGRPTLEIRNPNGRGSEIRYDP